VRDHEIVRTARRLIDAIELDEASNTTSRWQQTSEMLITHELKKDANYDDRDDKRTRIGRHENSRDKSVDSGRECVNREWEGEGA
jgi:hypothetical protein